MAVAAVWHPLNVKSGDVVVEQDEIGRELFYVAEGWLRVERRLPEGPAQLGRLQAGEIFGEMALVDGAPRMARVIAATPCRLYRMSAVDLATLRRAHPAAFSALLAAMIDDVLERSMQISRRLAEAFPPEKSPARPDPTPSRDLLSRVLAIFQFDGGKA